MNWDKLQEHLQRMFVEVELKHGDVRLTIQRQRKSESETALVVYINGWLKGAWAMPSTTEFEAEDREGHELAKLYWRERKVNAYSPAQRKKIEKEFGKRKAKHYFPNLHKTTVYYDAIYPKASVLIRNLKKLDGLTWENEPNEESATA